MYNFVYCLDENFNIQSAVSMYSLLENVDEKIIYMYSIMSQIHLKNIQKNYLNIQNVKVLT